MPEIIFSKNDGVDEIDASGVAVMSVWGREGIGSVVDV